MIKKIQKVIEYITKPQSSYRKKIAIFVLAFASVLILLAIFINVFVFNKAGFYISLEDQKAIKECVKKEKVDFFVGFVDTRASDCANIQATLYYDTDKEYSIYLCKTYYPVVKKDFYSEMNWNLEEKCKSDIEYLIRKAIKL